MAVVQISRIQVRRGQKNAGAGLPQLASGELGWAIDTREMYVGNGAVSEGAPAVGNTKILTEHDNIFNLAGQYTYKNDVGIQTGASATQPTKRSLQAKLDDLINGKDFGMIGDGSNNNVALQRAIDQLYVNAVNSASASSRVTLVIEPGEYLITTPIYVPPFVTIRGAGIDKTIINFQGGYFDTRNGSSTPGSPANYSTNTFLNQARHIHLEGMTLTQTSTTVSTLYLRSCRDSLFKNIKITGPWISGGAIVSTSKAIDLVGDTAAVMSNDNTFDNIEVTGFSYPFYSDWDIQNTIIKNCKFDTDGYGITLGVNTVLGNIAQTLGPSYTRIENCVFDEINRHAIWVKQGTNNQSLNNSFYAVGNRNGTEANSVDSVINFETDGNTSQNDYFQRFSLLCYDQNYFTNQKFTPIITGRCNFLMNQSDTIDITVQDPANRILRLPADADSSYEIDYVYHSTQVDAHRSGTIYITTEFDNEHIIIRDVFDYIGQNAFLTNLTFSATLADENNDSAKDTVSLDMLNTTSTDTGTFTFTIKSKR